MSFKVPSVASLERQFSITSVTGFDEIDDKNPIKVTFRQATDREDTALESWVNEAPATFEYPRDDAPVRQHVKSKPDRERRAYEVYLTLAACDIVVDDKGTPLFQFSDKAGHTKIAGSFANFQEKWGLLPSGITRAIHLKCLEANPDWAYYWMNRIASPGDESEGE